MRSFDSINDATLLAMVDYPILVQKPDGSYDPDIQLPRMIRAPGIGPVGWNEAILELIGTGTIRDHLNQTRGQ
jgi:mannosyl-3-phosphoglycerate phosphatase